MSDFTQPQQVEVERDDREHHRGQETARAEEAIGRIDQAAKDFKAWEADEESRISPAESTQIAEEHRLVALAFRRCAGHLRSQSSSELRQDKQLEQARKEGREELTKQLREELQKRLQAERAEQGEMQTWRASAFDVAISDLNSLMKEGD